jgi:hypothetical protein
MLGQVLEASEHLQARPVFALEASNVYWKPLYLANLSKHDRLWFTKSLAPKKSINPILLPMLLP